MSEMVVLIFLWWPNLDGPPSLITQEFASQQSCKNAGAVLTGEIDVPSTYINSYGYDHRNKPKVICVTR